MSKQSHRQRLIDTFINRIYLYDDKLMHPVRFCSIPSRGRDWNETCDPTKGGLAIRRL